jgi:hypothetical protein
MLFFNSVVGRKDIFSMPIVNKTGACGLDRWLARYWLLLYFLFHWFSDKWHLRDFFNPILHILLWEDSPVTMETLSAQDYHLYNKYSYASKE